MPLMIDPLTKTVSLLGKFRDQNAILTAEKSAFNIDPEVLSSLPASSTTPNLRVVQRNDIYHWYIVSSSSGQPEMKTTIIFPATDVHIRKHEKQKRHMVRETPEMYKEFVEPYVQSMKGGRIQWLLQI
jgi:m7GpppX diphosphatase